MLLASLFLCIGAALAQMKISGTVISSEDGQPVIGASVVVTGTGQGTVTNLDGQFTLTVPERAKLHISSAGMKAVDVTAKDNMRVVLEPLNTTLGEVVVTAMGIKRSAKALGFSATAVKGDEIAAARTNDIMSSLAQEESLSISENVIWGQRKRMADGKVSFAYSRFLGLDKDKETGKIVVNPEQAETVRLIFHLFLEGMTPHSIASELTSRGIKTPGGKDVWNQQTVRRMLSNEKFVSKAPQAKIDEEKKKLENYEQMLSQVREQLERLSD